MLRFASTCAFLFALYPAAAPGEQPTEEKWLEDRHWTVSPAVEPVPALRYRLFPLWSERKPGDAAPIYLRFAHERRDEVKKKLQEMPDKWNALPLDQLPLKEARQFVDNYHYNLKQLELGARRKSCDWNYTLEVEPIISILLPDAQEMRLQAGLLALKARVEIAEGKYADAVRTMETGFAFGEHVAEAHFLISGLIGTAVAHRIADCLPELIQRPDAPNLYWALTAMPRPLIGLRKALEMEERFADKMFPDLVDVDRPRSSEEWGAALDRVVKGMQVLTKQLPPGEKPPAGIDLLDKVRALPEARTYAKEKLGLPDKTVDEMSAPQLLLVHLAGEFRLARDDLFKAGYLPFPQAPQVSTRARKRMEERHFAWGGIRLLRALLPALDKVLLSQARMDRKIAVLRLVEALRLHAAANGGHLPESLDQVKVVPLPLDPATGKPFTYRLEGEGATIISDLPEFPRSIAGMRIHLSMRK